MPFYYDTGTAGSTTAWSQWTGTTASITQPTWTAWVNASATTSATCDAAWHTWTVGTVPMTTAGYVGLTTYVTWSDEVETRKETRKQKRARLQLAREAEIAANERRRVEREQQLQREAAQRAAEERAEQLLMQVLSPEQERAWKENRAFFVTGSKTGKRYKIRHGSHGNIKELDANGKEVASLCVNVPRGLPNHDNVVAQKLMLECHEEELLRVANRHTF